MLTASTTGLLVVDIQGKLARLVEESPALIANSARLVQGAQALGLPVVWLEQNPDKLGPTVPELQPLQSGAPVLTKFSFGALGEPAVSAALARTGRRHWLVCGIRGSYLRLPDCAGAARQRRRCIPGGGCGVVPQRRQPRLGHRSAGHSWRAAHLGGNVPL